MDMRQVLRQVREDQGPDAVILSNRRVDGGIEVIAAVDYDESLIRHALGSQPTASDDADAPDGFEVPGAEASDESSGRPVDNEVVGKEIAETQETHTGPPMDEVSDTVLHEPTLHALQSELTSMRSMMETQLASLVWKDKSKRSPVRAQVLRNLSRIGMAPDIANIIVNRLEPIDDIKQLWHAPLTTLAQAIPVAQDSLLQQGGIAALIGPTGVGKTTTIAKIASRYAMTRGCDEIALVCADAYRIGAREHLMAFANIIGLNVHAASDPYELMDILDRLSAKRLVLIDTEGMSQRDMDLSSRLAAYGKNQDRVTFYLTLSAASQETVLDETLQRFNRVPLKGAIVTKIDEAGQLGCVISALIRHDLPISYLSDGQRIPDDLHTAERKRLWLVNQAVQCMQRHEPQINERIMAENYSEVSVANA